jgi:hypothetical protein
MRIAYASGMRRVTATAMMMITTRHIGRGRSRAA